MNTGIQDAVNLGWKLAHTLRGLADPAVLDTYEPERAPVGRMVLRFTDRAFTIATSTNPIVRFIRTRIAPRLVPFALKPKAGRAYAFRIVSQFGHPVPFQPALPQRPILAPARTQSRRPASRCADPPRWTEDEPAQRDRRAGLALVALRSS